MSVKYVQRALVVVALVIIGAMLPGAGQSRPPESDGSTYTWTGAATLTVDVKPWGGAYVRSDPYLIDCPMGCTRAFDANREVKLTAYMTPGHAFKVWEGACAGQGNPCTIKVSGSMDVTAVVEGQYVPPPAPPAAVNPLIRHYGRSALLFLAGEGYHANSAIDVALSYVIPGIGPLTEKYTITSSGAGDWDGVSPKACNYPFLEPFDTRTYRVNVTATDAEGASASTQFECGE